MLDYDEALKGIEETKSYNALKARLDRTSQEELFAELKRNASEEIYTDIERKVLARDSLLQGIYLCGMMEGLYAAFACNLFMFIYTRSPCYSIEAPYQPPDVVRMAMEYLLKVRGYKMGVKSYAYEQLSVYCEIKGRIDKMTTADAEAKIDEFVGDDREALGDHGRLSAQALLLAIYQGAANVLIDSIRAGDLLYVPAFAEIFPADSVRLAMELLMQNHERFDWSGRALHDVVRSFVSMHLLCCLPIPSGLDDYLGEMSYGLATIEEMHELINIAVAKELTVRARSLGESQQTAARAMAEARHLPLSIADWYVANLDSFES